MSAEAVVLCGGGAAILLQIAHPSVAAGVARHSDFASAPLRRLEGTLDFVTAVVHGTDRDRAIVRARVNRAHRVVRGETDGAAYDAADPDLQRWVAATLYVAAREAHARAFGPASAAASQSLLDTFRAIGTELQMLPGAWPSTVIEFDQWWSAELASKQVGEDARAVFEQLRRPVAAPWLLRGIIPLVMRVSLAFLPNRLRRAFYPDWSKSDRFAAELFWVTVVPLYRVMPRGIRTALVGRQLRHVRRKDVRRKQVRRKPRRHGCSCRRGFRSPLQR